MAGSIYKMYYARMTEAWYQLSKEQQDAMFAKMGETGEKVGGKMVVLCDSSWSSEKWSFWGVEEYPSLEALQEYSKCLAELDWYRYCDSEVILGTSMPMPTPPEA